MSREAAVEKIRRWRKDPVAFVREQFQVEPDAWQKEVLEAFVSADPAKRRISEQACAGPGKSATLAWCGWLFLSCYGGKGEHPKGAAVSITAENLRDNLWPEFAKWRSRSAYLMKAFEWTSTRIFAREHPETWFMSARAWSKTANAEEQGRTLSGLHSEYVLVLIDESGGVPQSVLKAGEQALGRCKFGKMLQAGNPTSLEGILYLAATKLRHQWHVVRITGDPDDTNRSPRIDIEWAREQIKTHGREDPWVKAYILGEFPPASINVLLGPEEVESAMKRSLREDEYSFSQKRIGIDVARFGDDVTVIFPRQGLAAFAPVEMRGARTPDIAARVAAGKAKWGSELEFIDSTGGWGGGVEDALLQAGIHVVPVNFSGAATDPRYFNKRSEIWFQMAEWVKRGGALPNRPGLLRELTTPVYTFVGGKFRLEEKDQIKKRLGFSPNEADALATTFAQPDMPTALMAPMGGGTRGKAVSEWDPFREEAIAGDRG